MVIPLLIYAAIALAIAGYLARERLRTDRGLRVPSWRVIAAIAFAWPALAVIGTVSIVWLLSGDALGRRV